MRGSFVSSALLFRPGGRGGCRCGFFGGPGGSTGACGFASTGRICCTVGGFSFKCGSAAATVGLGGSREAFCRSGALPLPCAGAASSRRWLHVDGDRLGAFCVTSVARGASLLRRAALARGALLARRASPACGSSLARGDSLARRALLARDALPACGSSLARRALLARRASPACGSSPARGASLARRALLPRRASPACAPSLARGDSRARRAPLARGASRVCRGDCGGVGRGGLASSTRGTSSGTRASDVTFGVDLRSLGSVGRSRPRPPVDGRLLADEGWRADGMGESTALPGEHRAARGESSSLKSAPLPPAPLLSSAPDGGALSRSLASASSKASE